MNEATASESSDHTVNSDSNETASQEQTVEATQPTWPQDEAKVAEAMSQRMGAAVWPHGNLVENQRGGVLFTQLDITQFEKACTEMESLQNKALADLTSEERKWVATYQSVANATLSKLMAQWSRGLQQGGHHIQENMAALLCNFRKNDALQLYGLLRFGDKYVDDKQALATVRNVLNKPLEVRDGNGQGIYRGHAMSILSRSQSQDWAPIVTHLEKIFPEQMEEEDSLGEKPIDRINHRFHVQWSELRKTAKALPDAEAPITIDDPMNTTSVSDGYDSDDDVMSIRSTGTDRSYDSDSSLEPDYSDTESELGSDTSSDVSSEEEDIPHFPKGWGEPVESENPSLLGRVTNVFKHHLATQCI